MLRWNPRDFPRGEGTVRCAVQAPTAVLCLDNARRKNAVSPGMMADLQDAVASLEAREDLSALIVHGAQDAFCSGGDLTAVREHLLQPGAGAGMCSFMTATLSALARLPVVRIGAVTGPALGGGAELLTVCDVVYAAPAARIGFVHASLGVSPGWGGGRRLVERVGRRHALRLLTEARRLSAAEAEALGLVDAVVADPIAEAQAHAARLAALPVAAVRAAVSVAQGGDEAALFSALWGGADHRAILAGVRAGR